ncbi:MAG: catalase [Lachnospiraceae bacterium]|nr:catalase [Lachnospiraceae bacterium]
MNDTFRRFCGHFTTITKHHHQVFIHCVKAGIPLQGLTHDLSKYTPEEFIPGVRYYTGVKSPNEGERKDLGYSRAWMHHKGRNKHHFEYWSDIDPVTQRYEPVPMPMRYVIEMFCDRVAASKVYARGNYNDTMPLEYYLKNKKYYVGYLHPKSARILEKLFRMLASAGEVKTFAYIRSLRIYKI